MTTWRTPYMLATLTRLAYGVGSMLAPEWIASRRLAPSLQGHPDPRMTLRGFGGAQTAIALYTLASLSSPRRARSVLGLNAAVDLLDAGVSLLERRARGRFDHSVTGGVAINVAVLLCWSAASGALPRDPHSTTGGCDHIAPRSQSETQRLKLSSTNAQPPRRLPGRRLRPPLRTARRPKLSGALRLTGS